MPTDAPAVPFNHKVNTDAKKHRAETFATTAITTLTNQDAASFNFGNHKILISCWRTYDKVTIQKIFPRDRVPGFSHTVNLPTMGVILYCSDTLCSIFPLDDQELQPGQTYHHFLVKHGDREMLASVSLDIRPITKPTAAKYNRDIQFRAAFDAYRAKCRKAQDELQEEFERIMDIHADRIYASLPTQTAPAAITKTNPKSSQRIIARKSKVR